MKAQSQYSHKMIGYISAKVQTGSQACHTRSWKCGQSTTDFFWGSIGSWIVEKKMPAWQGNYVFYIQNTHLKATKEQESNW